MSLFRKQALAKVSSPERLDEALIAAEPRHWVAFVAAAVIVAVALTWGFFGSIPTRINATGILLEHDSEIFSATAEGDGQIMEFLVTVGDVVERGQAIALLKQDVNQAGLDRANEALEDSLRRLDDLMQERDANLQLHEHLNLNQLKSISERIVNAEQKAQSVEARLDDLRDLLEDGFIDRTTVFQQEIELADVREQMSELLYAELELELDLSRTKEEWRQRIEAQELEVEVDEAEIENLQELLRLHGTVDAPVTGTVTEISASLGDVVHAGLPVVRIVSEGEDKDALLFVSPRDGKLIQPGFVVNLEPSVVKKEDVGTALAEVASVSDLPLSPSAIDAMLHNDKLVEEFSKEGAPIVVRAHLLEDDTSASGMVWSGGSGPDFTIGTGTLLSATITIREQAPVTLIMPFLKSVLGL